MAVKQPKMPRQASGKTKPKAVHRANPTPPPQRGYPWGGPAIRNGTRRGKSNGSY